MTVPIDQLLDVPKNTPVVIRSYYRAGSTALCSFIEKHYNYQNFDEAFHNSYPKRRNNFFDYKENNDWVIKIMGDQWDTTRWPCQNDLWDRAYKIKLTRRNFEKQLISWYISYKTKKWHQKADEKNDLQFQDYTVPLSEHWMKIFFAKLSNYNRMVDNFRANYDYELVYEDLKIDNSDFIRRQIPSNYDQIQDLAKKIIKLSRR